MTLWTALAGYLAGSGGLKRGGAAAAVTAAVLCACCKEPGTSGWGGKAMTTAFQPLHCANPSVLPREDWQQRVLP